MVAVESRLVLVHVKHVGVAVEDGLDAFGIEVDTGVLLVE
jgi:hypothetical protein